jgi:hypothetical protein
VKITVEIILDDEEAEAVERIAETLEKPDHTQDFDELVESYVMGLVADKVMCNLLQEAANG